MKTNEDENKWRWKQLNQTKMITGKASGFSRTAPHLKKKPKDAIKPWIKNRSSPMMLGKYMEKSNTGLRPNLSDNDPNNKLPSNTPTK